MMKKISKGIVFSNDIKKILSGGNAFDYKYVYVPSDSVINDLRKDFNSTVNKIFDKVTIVNEEEMLNINNIVKAWYPHC